MYLVAEDPATCAIYFLEFLIIIISILSAMSSYNPPGKYRVVDYFVRILFQRRASAYARVLFRLGNDREEAALEHIPRTIQMKSKLMKRGEECSYG